MSHPKFGEKFTCAQCGTKFYDLKKPKPLCPKCGSKPKKARKSAAPKPTKRPVISTEEYDNSEEDSIVEDGIEELSLGADTSDHADTDDNELMANDFPDQEY